MSDLLEYLRINSKVAVSLSDNGDPTLEDLLMSYCKTPEQFTRTVELLSRLPQLEKDRFKVSNCLFDGELPYDSLKNATADEIEELCILADYLQLDEKIENKLQNVVKYGINFRKYLHDFHIEFLADWARIGDLRGLQRFCETGGALVGIDHVYCNAAVGGYLDCLQYLHEHVKLDMEIAEFYRVCEAAANGGHFDCLKWLHEQGYPWDKSTCSGAAQHSLEMLKYAREPPLGDKCDWDSGVYIRAARGGRLDCMQYADAQGCPWHKKLEQVCEEAALGGNIECIRFARARGCIWNTRVAANAAKNGHLECLRYLHETGCPWDRSTSYEAAYKGHLDCLEYAYTHGCPLDKQMSVTAATSGRLNCLKFLVEIGCSLTSEIIETATRGGHLNCLRYAHEAGCPWPERWNYENIQVYDFDCLKYLHENGCPIKKWKRSDFWKSNNPYYVYIEANGLFLD